MNNRRLAFLVSTIALAAFQGSACGHRSPAGYEPPAGDGRTDANVNAGDDASGAQFANGYAGADGVSPVTGNGGCNDATCACALAGGAWSGSVCTLSENPGKIDPATQGKLAAGGTADSTFKLVYPYDATVFPRGLLPPTLQFSGTAPSAVYVHVSASGVDYKGYFGPSNPGRAAFSGPAWAAITLGAKASETLKVEVTKISGSAVAGPVTESWTVAQGSLRGVIYYETYGSAILGGIASVGIMKIQPGAAAPIAVASGCGNVCHTASADGSTLVSGSGFAGITSVSYDLKSTAKIRKAQPNQSFVYGGLFPNGSVVMSSTNYRTWMGAPSRLYDTTTGANLAAPGWDGVITNAAMPAFSPDGTKIVFNHEDTGAGKSLAVMSYNAGTRTFSGLVDVASDATRFLGWPAFTPDTKTVIYHAGSSSLFETDKDSNTMIDAAGDLMAVDIASKKTARLDKLDGYSGASSYLPAHDPNLNFAPTVLPEAVGGYFWAVFTSHRSYGNTLPSKDNGDQNGKLWVAAIDIAATPGTDPSHPAFYLDGQEAAADNLRGFWVLNPCKDDGDGCLTGDECCGGYCRPGKGGAPSCAPEPAGCASEYEKCAKGSDCCTSGAGCINGKCAAPLK